MGYTHYFPQTRAFTNDEWIKILKFTKDLFKYEQAILANGMGDIGTKPDADDDSINFNGVGDEAHETCHISKAHNTEFNFTKTAQKEYDRVVVAILTYINHVAPNALNIASDGRSEPELFIEGTMLARLISKDPSILPIFT